MVIFVFPNAHCGAMIRLSWRGENPRCGTNQKAPAVTQLRMGGRGAGGAGAR